MPKTMHSCEVEHYSFAKEYFFHKRLVGVTCCLDVIKMPIKIIVKYMHTFFPDGNVHKMHVKCTCVSMFHSFVSELLHGLLLQSNNNELPDAIPSRKMFPLGIFLLYFQVLCFLFTPKLPALSVGRQCLVYSKSTQFLQQEMCNLTCDCATTLYGSHQTQYFLWGKRKRRRLKK